MGNPQKKNDQEQNEVSIYVLKEQNWGDLQSSWRKTRTIIGN